LRHEKADISQTTTMAPLSTHHSVARREGSPPLAHAFRCKSVGWPSKTRNTFRNSIIKFSIKFLSINPQKSKKGPKLRHEKADISQTTIQMAPLSTHHSVARREGSPPLAHAFRCKSVGWPSKTRNTIFFMINGDSDKLLIH
jgi:hypothetical protein